MMMIPGASSVTECCSGIWLNRLRSQLSQETLKVASVPTFFSLLSWYTASCIRQPGGMSASDGAISSLVMI